MADVFSKVQRSAVMRRVLGTNTTPERVVRSALHKLGFRFRLRPQPLPGRPDVVLARHRAVIFCHGCFWHQHAGCEAAARPASNQVYWNAKLDRNVRRDRANVAALRKQGWRVVIVWECQTKRPHELQHLLQRRLR